MKRIQPIVLALIISLISSCGEKTQHQNIYHAGVIENGIFRHESFGVTMKIPNGWYTSNFSALKKAQRAGANDAMKEHAEYLSSDIDGRFPLLTISKYPLNKQPKQIYNPTLTITATSKELLAQYGMDTLSEKMRQLKLPPPLFVVESGTPYSCGNTNGLYALVEARHPQVTINQDTVMLDAGSFIIDVVVSTIDPADREVLMENLNTITLN